MKHHKSRGTDEYDQVKKIRRVDDGSGSSDGQKQFDV
mgnify:CR=1 FL=1|jgi:hypothetical protein